VDPDGVASPRTAARGQRSDGRSAGGWSASVARRTLETSDVRPTVPSVLGRNEVVVDGARGDTPPGLAWSASEAAQRVSSGPASEVQRPPRARGGSLPAGRRERGELERGGSICARQTRKAESSSVRSTGATSPSMGASIDRTCSYPSETPRCVAAEDDIIYV
jgi:hypothetical protein